MADAKISQLTAATTPLAGSEVLPIVQSGATVKVSVDNLTTGKNVTVKGLTATSSADNNITVQATGTSTGSSLIIKSGNGTTSSLYEYVRFINDNTAGQDWRFGIYGDSDIQLVNVTGSKNLMRWTTGGDVTAPAGNLAFGTAAKGVNFTANTPAAGMTSQLLNWYEEGTWTPTVTSGTGTLTTVSGQAGTYTRVGRQVTVLCKFVIDTNGTGASYVLVTGLPFTPADTTPGYGTVPLQGKGLFVSFATGLGIILRFADGTYPGANGNNFFVGLTYNV